MAGFKLLGIAVMVLFIRPSEGRSIHESKRSLKNDQIVREMASLLQVRRFLSELKESARQVSTSAPSTPGWIDVQESGSSSHVQLCTDAVSFLSGQKEEVFEKRNLVINYVVNYCIRPSASTDTIALILALQAAAAENDQSGSLGWDWSNWPGTTIFTPPPSSQSTTPDYWQQLFDELVKFDDNGDSSSESPIQTESPIYESTTEDWFEQFIAELFPEDEVFSTSSPQTTKSTISESTTEDWFEQFIAELFPEDEVFSTSSPPTPQSTTEDVALEEAFNDFWNLIEGEEGKNEEEENKEEEEGNGVGEEEEEEEDEFNALLGLLNQEQGKETEAEPTLPTEDVVEENDDVSNDLPPLDTNRRVVMKKRLLDLLAKSLLRRRQEMMRK